MKPYLTIIITFVFFAIGHAQQELLPAYPKEINYKGDMAFFNGAPFTGLLVEEESNKPLGVFKNGYKNGTFTEYYNNGKKKGEVNYAMGIKDGIETEWYESGQKSKEVKIIKGLPDGLLREWNYDGTLKREISFSNGKIEDGEYTIFDEKGAVIESSFYKNNLIIEKKYSDGKLERFYETGELKFECYLNDYGNQDGTFTEWWINGSKKSEGIKTNGKFDGKLTTWNEDSFKTSEQYYKNGKKDSISVFWEEKGLTRTRYFKDDILINEEIVNPANLISNISLNRNEYLFYYLTGEGKDKVFVKLKINDKTFENDRMKRNMVSNLLSSIQKRLVRIPNKSIYNDKYLSFTVELFDLKYFADGEYSENSNKTMYTGNCSYKIKLYNNQNKLINEGRFNSKEEKTFFITSYGDKSTALRKGIKKADCENFMYKFFPIKSEIIEIISLRGNKANTVKISAGTEIGVKKNLKFNIYSRDLLKSTIVGELKVIEVNPTYSLCKVTQGKEIILSKFESDKKITIISNL
jgi:antitoxin component YwqK of YwqJK toxin-antitoxin module